MFKEVEELVTTESAKGFTFKRVVVKDDEDRVDLEERLIATLAQCPACESSVNWLGHSAAAEEMRESGL